MTTTLLPVADVKVGERARQHAGDLGALMNSLREVGMLHPIVVDSRHNLIAGGRRLTAARRLGWDEVPANVVTLLDDATAALRAERDENTCRLDMTPSEMVALGRRLEELEKPKAKERMSEGAKVGKVSTPSKARDAVGKALGVSGRTYEKAKAVIDAAEDETLPAAVRAVATEARAEMDRTGKVDGAAKKVERARAGVIAIEGDPETSARFARQEHQYRWAKAMRTLTQVAVDFPADDTRDWLTDDDITSMRLSLRALNGWAKQIEAARSGLRLVGKKAQ